MTYYSTVPVQIDSQNDYTGINNNGIISGQAIQIQYTDLQQYEHANAVTTLPVIQTNAQGEDVYHAGLEAQDFYIPSTPAMISSDVGVDVGGSIFNGSSPITVQALSNNGISESTLALVTSGGASFLPHENLITGKLRSDIPKKPLLYIEMNM